MRLCPRAYARGYDVSPAARAGNLVSPLPPSLKLWRINQDSEGGGPVPQGFALGWYVSAPQASMSFLNPDP